MIHANRTDLIGTAVQPSAGYQGDIGEWYEKIKPGEIDKVISNHLFVMDRHSGKTRWLYKQGAIISSTITVAKDFVYFVESRNEKALSDTGRSAKDANSKQFLVCLDKETGLPLWDI